MENPWDKARVIEIAEAFVEDLNKHVAKGMFVAKRTYYPEYSMAQMDRKIQVDVVIGSTSSGEESRGSTEDTFPIEIGVQCAVSRIDVDTIDVLIGLTSTIASRYPTTQPLQVDDFPEMAEILGDRLPIQVIENECLLYDPLCLREKEIGHFHSRIALTIRELGR